MGNYERIGTLSFEILKKYGGGGKIGAGSDAGGGANGGERSGGRGDGDGRGRGAGGEGAPEKTGTIFQKPEDGKR
ncbi:hypothetical protein E3N88_15574 [Mikania micrantha]|uniref:Uncharacterized protein n=1 Tax=Mikania micrantha TaxID=192012 RepID=A0A5N6NW04_9ASTR|nr:hypothetical protein E3N88_15574 [Mikania micrantha]